MRYFAILAGICACAPLVPAGTVCSSGSLASYEALGSSGCLINGDLFYDFVSGSGFSGATQLDPSLVTLTPSVGSTTLMVSINESPADTSSFEALFDYQILETNPITGEMVTLSNSSETNGDVTYLQNYCVGGTFDTTTLVTTCSGSGSGGFALLDGVENTDSNTFAAATFMSVTDDLEVDGPASGGTGTDAFTASGSASAVPEPATLTLFALGAALCACLKFKTQTAKKGN
jgi:PEP-CTERM motif